MDQPPIPQEGIEMPHGNDGLGGLGDALSNVGSFITGGLLPDAQNQHQGILAEAVKCLFGHDPWAAESWGGAVKQTAPANASEPSNRPSYAASTDPKTGLDPAKVALANVAVADQQRAQAFKDASVAAVNVAPGLSVTTTAAPTGDSGAQTAPSTTEVSGDSIRAANAGAAEAASNAHPDGSPPQSAANSPVAPVASERAKNLAASQSQDTSQYSPVPDPGKPQIWTHRSDLDRNKPAGALSNKREAAVQATGGRPGPLTMSAPAAPPAFWQVYKGSGVNSPAKTPTGAYGGANANEKVVPNNANFATEETFGEPGKNLVKFRTSSGANVTVNKLVAGNFQGFLGEIEGAGYHIKPEQTAGFANRNIANSSKMSQHSLGNAVDINWDDNTVQSAGKNTLPPNVAQIAAKYGLTWGGTWRKQDTMHFEYHPVHGVPMRPLSGTQ